jgi:hypothetical protein
MQSPVSSEAQRFITLPVLGRVKRHAMTRNT